MVVILENRGHNTIEPKIKPESMIMVLICIVIVKEERGSGLEMYGNMNLSDLGVSR
jgi:hypothetical protein